MNVKLINTISSIDADEWNAVVGQGYPFISHEFLQALEESGCVSPETGWHVQHLLLYSGNRLTACMPLYLKDHSRGEYVFDHQWAHSYAHYDLDYYPKWVTAIPFTPCQHRRIFTVSDVNEEQVIKVMLAFLQEHAEINGISSWHCLFPEQEQAEVLQSLGLLLRSDVQFHWRNKGYRDFDDFLATLNTKYRKKIRRERRRINELDVALVHVSGSEISELQLRVFYEFYLMTYRKKGMPPYLNLDFFTRLVTMLPETLLFVFAIKNNRYVAAALSLNGSGTLYGRYWGCYEEFHSLHFETCYYQGIEYCIKNKLSKFDSGAQGEHKIARGFEPVITYSVHWIRNPEFAQAIKQFLVRERAMIQQYKSDKEQCLPYRWVETKESIDR